MSLNNNIQNALTSQLANIVGLPPIAYSNVEFNPVQGSSYIRPTLIPAKSVIYSLTQGKHMGIYQVDIFTQVDKGSAPLFLIADSIRDAFKANLSLVSGGDTIFIQEVGISKAQRVDGWWTCFVEVNYLCFN